MIIADKTDKKNTFKVAFLTIYTIFIMGYLNALALSTYDLGAMITAQTGNVIWIGIFAASGYWAYLLETVSHFLGFGAGAIFALNTHKLFPNTSKQFYWNWTFFALPIALYPVLFQYILPPFVSFFILTFSAGATLGFFRNVYHMEINTSMATASARFVFLHFAKAFFKKDTKGDKKEIATFWVFFAAIFSFAFGAFIYAMFTRLDATLNTGLNLSLGYYYGTARLTLGLSEIWYGRYEYPLPPAGTSNVTRVIGLWAFYIIGYFFCPKPTKTA